MSLLRLQRAQHELQAHRSWLSAFTAIAPFNPATRYGPSTSRTFSNRQACRAQKQIIGKARTPWQKKQKRKQDRNQHVGLETLSHREQLLQAVKKYDIKQVISTYGSLPEKKPLTPEDLNAIAQCVHQCFRLETYKDAKSREREDTNNIVVFAEQLVKDIRRERLLPSVFAHVHLLGVFKESGTRDAGIDFWKWLQEQDEEYVNVDVYAVAIDILARNGNPLEELEQLYQDALARFPGTFFAYHLSPDAILEDRNGAFTVRGVPMSLLLSITIARLLNGDSQKAYLALDTAFRLYPIAVPTRFFAAFKDERPASEFFTVFAMACRAGIQLPLAYYKELIMRLRKSSNLNSAHNHMAVIRAMLAATHLQIGAGGTMPLNTVNEMTIAATQILRLPGVQAIEAKECQRIVDGVLAIVKKMLEIFARYGALPGEAVFNSIITSIGGHGRIKGAIGIALADMKALGLEPSEVTRRSVLIAAGLLADDDLVQKSWQDIVDFRAQEDARPDVSDVSLLVKAARQAGIADFAREQFDLMKVHLDERYHAGVEMQFLKPLETQTMSEHRPELVAREILEGIEGLQEEIGSLDRATCDHPAIQDFSGQHLPIALIPPPEWLRFPNDEMRKIYDQFTTEQKATSSPAPGASDESKSSSSGSSIDDMTKSSHHESSSVPRVSATNIDYGTLRFQNWKAVNYLLWLSAKHDHEFNAAVDRAIVAGVSPPQRNMGITEDELVDVGPYRLDNAQEGFKQGSNVGYALVHQAKNEIFRLRGTSAT